VTSTETSGTSSPDAHPFVSITPELGSPIPGVTLSPATKNGEIVSVPFLAQYVNGVYRYLIGISLIAAIVMTVYGGFRYLVGASLGDIKSGKKIITDAIGGMLIILAAYMILNTINPATLNLSILQLEFIPEQAMDFENEVDFAPEGGTVGSPSGSPSLLPSIDPRTFQRYNDTCMHTNTPVAPIVVQYLQRASQAFCNARGSHTDWTISCGGYRSPETQLRLWLTRCYGRDHCSPAATCNPIPPSAGKLIRNAANQTVYAGNPTITDQSQLFDLLSPFVDARQCPHTSGVGLDCYCNVSQSAFTPLVACQVMLEQAMADAGMCRLRHESWHFEPNDYRVSVNSCLSPWTIGTVQPNPSVAPFNYGACPASASITADNQRCIR
jgi:D-alanyl-D-alanine dipeptidase